MLSCSRSALKSDIRAVILLRGMAASPTVRHRTDRLKLGWNADIYLIRFTISKAGRHVRSVVPTTAYPHRR